MEKKIAIYVCVLTQLCPTLWNPINCNLPDSSVHRILYVRISEWVAIPSFRGFSWPGDRLHVSCASWTGRWILHHCTTWSESESRSAMSDSVISWTITFQASLSKEFSSQEYWSGLLFHSPGDLPDPEIKPRSPALQVDSWPSDPPGKPLNGYLRS